MIARIVRAFSLVVVGVFAVTGAAHADEAFFMPVEDAFYISGVGVVATGTVVRGLLENGAKVDVVGQGRDASGVTVLRIDQSGKALPSAGPGDNVGLILRGVDQGDVARGQVIVAAGAMAAHTKITAEITMLAEGGRKTPVADGYRPLLRIWTESVAGKVALAAELAPGGSVTAPIVLEAPVALQVGDAFAITEGGREVGSGKVVSVDD